MLGNSSTNPKGIEILEFPRNLIRRRKKENFGNIRDFSLVVASVEGGGGVEGNLLNKPLTKLIVDAGYSCKLHQGSGSQRRNRQCHAIYMSSKT